ncbi:MAG: hypothetical protein KHW40_03180 [Eggerthella sp.]|nr:hypothetical protein [Eggerthella sp.]
MKMPALQVKDCPTEVYEELRRCASRENRSISQQALTILEDYLGFRDFAPHDRSVSASKRAAENNSYREKRKRIFERIDKLPAIPVSELAPSSADILAEIREKEAR